MRSPIVEMTGVDKRYGHGDATVEALSSIDLRIDAGQMVTVVGPSGSGKSTLMNILGCLDTPSGGVYRFAGEDVTAMSEAGLAGLRNRRIGFVFQQFHLLGELPAWRNVELPLLYRRAADRRDAALAALAEAGLPADRRDHRPTQLSGGQQQRVAIARALVTDPDLILADEPTGNLDSVSTREILALLSRLHRAGRTVVIITHDPAVARIGERVIEIRDGSLRERAAAA